MSSDRRSNFAQHSQLIEMRGLADQAFSRAAGAPLIEGNTVTLLKDAAENYPAWLEAIASAKHYVHFESYIIHDDEQGWKFAEAFAAKAKQGITVRVLYDWMGGFGRTSRKFWNYLASMFVATTRRAGTRRWDGSVAIIARR